MQKIKVCHIITKLELGGAQQNTIFTVNHLNRDLYEPVLICGSGGILDNEVKNKGIKLYFIPFLIRQINPFKDFLAFWKLYKILKLEKPEIVHTHSSKAGILGRWAAYFAGVPIIIHTFHGYGFHDYQRWIVKKIYIFLEKISAKISDKLIAVTSEDIAKGFQYKIGSQSQYTIIRSGIDISFYKKTPVIDYSAKKQELSISINDKIITTIGPFKPQKNLIDFIKAAKIVSDKYQNCTFLVSGDGSQRPELEAMIKKLGMVDKIKLIGWRRDINEILSITDVFVMTSLWEGLPRSILEAMCCGLPVVANAVDGVREVVMHGETGFLCKPFDLSSMADYILKLLNDKNLCIQIGKKAAKLIDVEFDIYHMVSLQEKLYTELINQN